MSAIKKLVIFVSGNGSNLQAVIDAVQNNTLPIEIAAVISNKKKACGLERARKANIPAIYMPKYKEQERVEYDRILADKVLSYQPDLIFLAGWMRLFSMDFLKHFPNKIFNIHPALPGCFPGIHVVERTFEAYKQGKIEYTGVMTHLVPDEGVDDGPVLFQKIVPIKVDDTLETLEKRVQNAEHQLCVETIKNLLENKEV